jgi:hypothetical protein
MAVILESKLVGQCLGWHPALENYSEASGQPKGQNMDQTAEPASDPITNIPQYQLFWQNMSLTVILDSKLVGQCPGWWCHQALETTSESSGQPQSQNMDCSSSI